MGGEGVQEVPGGQGGHLGDPMRPSSWFDECSDDSGGIYACIYVIQIFLADGLTDEQTEVFHDMRPSWT